MIKLRELFDNPSFPTKVYRTKKDDELHFNIGAKKYRVYMEDEGYFENDRFDDLVLERPYKITYVEFVKVIGGVSIVGISPSDNPIRVFSSVIDIIKKNIDRSNVIRFSAKAEEPSRIKLYDHLVKYFGMKDYILKTAIKHHEKIYYLIPKMIIMRQ